MGVVGDRGLVPASAVRKAFALLGVAALAACDGASRTSDTRISAPLRLADIHRAEDWFHAMRAYPNGVPAGARETALRQAATMPAKLGLAGYDEASSKRKRYVVSCRPDANRGRPDV
jgi:hypothetical protein